MKKPIKSFNLIVLLLMGVSLFAVWRYYHGGVLMDWTKTSAEFEDAVNEILVRHQILDDRISKTIRIEKKENFPIPASWIETQRTIVLPSETKAQMIIGDIRQTASASHIETFRKNKEGRRLIVSFGKGRKIFQKMTFFITPKKKIPPGKETAKIAIVIDDVAGRQTDLKKLDEFFALKIPVTYAVLPMEKISRRTAEKIYQADDEVILHQPMEPENMAKNDPGKAVILATMTVSEIKTKLEKNLQTVPYASGISNHMGSHFTSNWKAVESLLTALKKINGNSLFFFDSHTTAHLVSPSIANQLRVKSLVNDVFFDNEDDVQTMLKQLDVLKRKAKKDSAAAGIGHIQRKHIISALRKAIPMLQREGIEFVYLSELLGER